MYRSTRGRELPGNYNHALLMELFHHQSKRWKHLAANHLDDIYDNLVEFVVLAAQHVITDELVRTDILENIQLALRDKKKDAVAELDRLCDDERQQPITYNHYYTDNVQKSRHDATRNLIRTAMKEASVQEYNGKMHISNNTVDAEKLLGALQRRVVVDMDEQACAEAMAGLSAYYKVIHIATYNSMILTRDRWHGKHSWIMCANKSSSDISYDTYRRCSPHSA